MKQKFLFTQYEKHKILFLKNILFKRKHNVAFSISLYLFSLFSISH